jgi:uncharacterized protein YdaU (DUF1376 family)
MPREPRIHHVDWYADEWLAGTARLDATERGVYDTIINLIYSRGGPISNDRRELARLCNIHGNTLLRVLRHLTDLGKILDSGSEIFVKRCGNELEKARIRARKAWENGEKGGRPSKKIKDVAKAAGCFSENLTTNYQRKKDSDADASAAVTAAKAPDPVKELWDRGLAILGKNRRSVFAKYLKTYDAVIVLAAIVETENEQPFDALPYFIRACERRKANGKHDHARAIADLGEWARREDEQESFRGHHETAR